MAKKYKLYPIKTIKDWENEDWDVYEERKSLSGIMIYRGWPYALTPRDGIGGVFSHILSPEIAEFLKVHSITESEQQLGLNNGIVAKFRRRLGIQNKFIYRNDQWLLAHKDELLYDSLETLKAKYGLKRTQVYKHKKWLAELIEIPIRKKMRKTSTDELQEQWFQKHKAQMSEMEVDEIALKFNVSHFIATKTYNRIRQELGELTFSAQFQQNKQDKYQWLLAYQEELLNSGKTVAELAEQFQKTNGQILRAKARLREILKIQKVQDQNREWLLANQDILFHLKLSKEETAKRLNIEPSQVYRKRGQLKKLLNIPHHNDLVQAWRLENQEVLLSLHLSISEIAKILNQKEGYIVRNREILRKILNISFKDQIKAWVLEHQNDLENLTMDELQEKYGIGQHRVQSYRKLLIELK
ncbi:hypothetical protein KTH46_11360 [Acinetobacter bereziniae]|uniref:hypothetical protein n=1 Tax=Acinetobacter bereziniae TaxID=106648 RepID=UPI0021CFCABF|nr:hypothetical protein [Acinetobacter bereziniae]MCU4315618.1 hypothetical protein [Acinetobacter bereziniae]